MCSGVCGRGHWSCLARLVENGRGNALREKRAVCERAERQNKVQAIAWLLPSTQEVEEKILCHVTHHNAQFINS